MKNIKKLLVGAFAALSLTEISYPIIFTGPARRNANREKQEQAALEAYELGRAEANRQSSEENQSYQEESVETQSYDDNISDTNENYADDAVVQIQSLGDGQFLSQLSPEKKSAIESRFQNLSPEKKAAIK